MVDPVASQLAEQLHSLHIETTELERQSLLRFLDEMLHWNRRYNLTAITERMDAVERHLVDSLSLLKLGQLSGPLLDIGSGPGLPGIPLGIVRPELEIVSLERTGKKALFQKHVVRYLSLKNVRVLNLRAEQAISDPTLGGSCSAVVSRAFSDLIQFGRLALPFLRSGGELLAMKGPAGRGELERASETLAGYGLHLETEQALRLPATGAERLLLRFRYQP
ncbi:MAG: 16S rRNA (guanine(527)-N(7))-methyltransferase RsmG [Desulfuromonas sp.]|nr:MAG: 16S rRNA (guanine(527)-N(7))-methyltransferase RsmG [Desulfuromonas sp.]